MVLPELSSAEASPLGLSRVYASRSQQLLNCSLILHFLYDLRYVEPRISMKHLTTDFRRNLSF